jgi:small subunit ribosomal protein S6
MAHPYEVVYIFDPALDEETITQKLATFHALVKLEGSEPSFNHWGKRTLAYPIRRQDTGYYVVANFDAEPAALPEFERAIKLDEGVIRHLVVLNDVPPTPAQAVPVKPDYEEEE